MMHDTYLTGITTTGTPHIGNYVGAIRPGIAASKDKTKQNYYFLADYHALAKAEDPERINRSTLEIAAANERLTELHAAILGEWRREEDTSAPGMVFEVSDGFLAYVREDRDPSYLAEPDENGTMVMMSATYVSFTPEVNDAGEIEAIQIGVGGEDRNRLVRAAE